MRLRFVKANPQVAEIDPGEKGENRVPPLFFYALEIDFAVLGHQPTCGEIGLDENRSWTLEIFYLAPRRALVRNM